MPSAFDQRPLRVRAADLRTLALREYSAPGDASAQPLQRGSQAEVSGALVPAAPAVARLVARAARAGQRERAATLVAAPTHPAPQRP